MTLTETLSAFACGAAAVVMTHMLFVDIDAQSVTGETLDVCVNSESVMRVIAPEATCAAGERRIRLKQPDVERACETAPRADVEALRSRIAALEGRTNEGVLEKATAPFQVVNEAGTVVFSVEAPDPGTRVAATEISNETGARIAVIAANPEGGAVSVQSANQNPASVVSATLDAFGEYSGLTVRASSDRRLELGRRENGRYSLALYGNSGKVVAGFGESNEGSGLAMVFDAAGKPRASLGGDSADGPGMVRVFDAAAKVIAALSAMGKGGSGLLQLRNNADEVMVEAGVLDTGIGVVRAGPGAFQHGLGFIGLPASYIEGKK